MALIERLRGTLFAPPARDPAERSFPWPVPVIALLALAGLLSPLICFAAAATAYALADRNQGALLLGAGLTHILLGQTLFAGS